LASPFESARREGSRWIVQTGGAEPFELAARWLVNSGLERSPHAPPELLGVLSDGSTTTVRWRHDRAAVSPTIRIEGSEDGESWTTLSKFLEQGYYFNPMAELVERSGIASWAILAERESSGRPEIASIIFLTLVSEEGEGTVYIGDDSASLDFQATLGEPLTTQAGLDYTLDWSEVTTDGSGQPFNSARVNQLSST
jgi:hypothetical protein